MLKLSNFASRHPSKIEAIPNHHYFLGIESTNCDQVCVAQDCPENVTCQPHLWRTVSNANCNHEAH